MEPRDGDAGLSGRITLLTDFGTRDGYVAAMRGVIATRSPACMVDDASHAIPAGDIRAGVFALGAYWQTYPPGTVHLVVIDPGVGTARRPIVVSAEGRHAVGPDNGVLTPLLDSGGTAREIRSDGLGPASPSATFHGRDIFAPTAAWLAAGGLPEDVGPVIADPVRLAVEALRESTDGVLGTVVHVDRFGTLVTNIPGESAGKAVRVDIEGQDVGPVRLTYGDVATGEVVALVGSRGFLEISVRDGSAADRLGFGPGASVRVRFG